MAAVSSTMLPLGTQVPAFTLIDAVSGMPFGVRELRDADTMLVMFICNHCPYVKHIMGEFGRLERDYRNRGLRMVAINANDLAAYPQDGPEHMKQLAEERGWGFPYLFDATQEVARAFRAACTPDFFLFDGGQRLVYRGQFDGARPGNDVPVTGADLRAAIEATLAGALVTPDQVPSIGCNIKWAKGNEPDYFAR